MGIRRGAAGDRQADRPVEAVRRVCRLAAGCGGTSRSGETRSGCIHRRSVRSTAEDGEGDETTSEGEQTDNTESDVTTDIQNKNLANDFIELYYRIDEIMNQIRTDCKTNIRYNPNMQTVRRNLTKLKETTYAYITNKFIKESYVTNLYQFNLIIQALNVNIELLSSVLDSNRAFKEKQNGRNKKKTQKKTDK